MTAPLVDGTCEWTEDDDGVWTGTCGCHFAFDTVGPVENGFAFCPYCGMKLVEVRPEPESEDEDG